MTSYIVTASPTNTGFTPDHALGMFEGRTWPTTGWLVTGDLPRPHEIPNGINPIVEVTVVSRSGTIASGHLPLW